MWIKVGNTLVDMDKVTACRCAPADGLGAVLDTRPRIDFYHEAATFSVFFEDETIRDEAYEELCRVII